MAVFLKSIRIFLLIVSFFAVSFVTLILALFRPFNPKNAKIWSNLALACFKVITNIKPEFDVDLKSHPSPCFYVGNHQDEFDTMMYSQALPYNSVSIGKKSIKWIPFFGQLYVLCGHILIDRNRSSKAYSVLDQVTSTMVGKHLNVVIFAEGTRSRGRGLLPFKKGAFRMAIKSQLPIVPVVISWNYKHIDLSKWRPGRIIFKDCAPIETKGMTMADIESLALKTRQSMETALESLDQKIFQEQKKGLLAETP